MKNYLLMTFLALGFLGATASNAATVVNTGSYVEVAPTLSKKGKDFGSSLYLNTSFKVNESWTVTPEYMAGLTFAEAGEAKFDASFAFARILVGGPVLKKWSDKRSFKLEYRYALPLDSASQLAGSYGSIAVRPVFNWDFNSKFSTMVRASTGIGLHRNGYQVNAPVIQPPDYTGADGNVLFSTAPEFFLFYSIDPKFTLYTVAAPAFAFKAAAKGSSETSWLKFLTHQTALAYELNKKVALEAGILVEKIAYGENFALFSAETNQYYVQVGYKF